MIEVECLPDSQLETRLVADASSLYRLIEEIVYKSLWIGHFEPYLRAFQLARYGRIASSSSPASSSRLASAVDM